MKYHTHQQVSSDEPPASGTPDTPETVLPRHSLPGSALSRNTAERAWCASLSGTTTRDHQNYFLPKKTPYSQTGLDGNPTPMYHLPAVVVSPTEQPNSDNQTDADTSTNPSSSTERVGVNGMCLTTVDKREIANTERAWDETKTTLTMYQPPQDIPKLSRKLKRIRMRATSLEHPQAATEINDESLAAASSACVKETSEERALRRARRRARRKARQQVRLSQKERDDSATSPKHKHRKGKRERKRRTNACGMYGQVIVWCEPRKEETLTLGGDQYAGNSAATGVETQRGHLRAAALKAAASDVVLDSIRDFDDRAFQRKRAAKAALYFGRVRKGMAGSDGDSDSGDDSDGANNMSGFGGGDGVGGGHGGDASRKRGGGVRTKRKVQHYSPVLKPGDRPGQDVLKQGATGKAAVCLHLRVAGIRARDLRKPQEILAFKSVVLAPLSWVSLMMRKFTNFENKCLPYLREIYRYLLEEVYNLSLADLHEYMNTSLVQLFTS
jgi:hypothetical protein